MSKFTRLVVQAEVVTSLVRREMFDGREHVVVPCVMAKYQVMNDAVVPPEEWQASVESWNGRPVIILHPEQNGSYISVASSPQVFEKAVGYVFNTTYSDERLRGELWIDEAKLDKAGHATYLSEMLAGNAKEVSTGYISDAYSEPGELNGVPYNFIHRNLRPDHLALLPGEIGACSVADGCGAPRVNSCQCEACKSHAHQQRRSEDEIANEFVQLIEQGVSSLTIDSFIEQHKEYF